MARYRSLEDGSFELDTPAGPLPVAATEDQLLAEGHEPDAGIAPPSLAGLPPPPTGRLALDDGAGGQGNSPATASDAPSPLGGLGSGSGGAPNYGSGGGTEGAPAVPVSGGSGAPRSGGDRAEEKPREQAPAPATKRIRISGSAPAASAAPTRSGSGKPVEVARTVKLGKKVSQDQLDADSDAEIDVRLAAQNKADRDAGRAQRLGEVADADLARQEREISADEIKATRMRDEYARRTREIEDGRREVDEMEVDPDQLFGDGITFPKIMAGISIIAGGVLQGLKGLDKNPGLEAINQAVERNIAMQKERIARKRQGVADKETELERLMKIYGNPEIAERELRERQLGLAEAWAKRTMMDAPEDVQANLQTYFADRGQQRAKERMAIDQAAQDDVTIQMRSGGGGGGAAAKKSGPALGTERTEKIASFANAIVAARNIEKNINESGSGGDTWDNPTEGWYDRASNVFSSERKERTNRLNADTEALARGLQASLGKSDNDARLAEEQAVGTGSGKDRVRAAAAARTKMVTNIRAELATVSDDQKQEILQNLPPEVLQELGAGSAPASEAD